MMMETRLSQVSLTFGFSLTRPVYPPDTLPRWGREKQLTVNPAQFDQSAGLFAPAGGGNSAAF